MSVAVLAAAGPKRSEDLAATAHPLLGHGWVREGQPLTARDVRMSLSGLGVVLQGLDLVETDWPIWRPGPSARTLLPRATALSHLLSQATTADAER